MKQLLWINRWNERRKNSAKENQNIGYNFIINYTLNKYNRVFSDLCMGLRMNEGSQTSRYITFIPEKNNEVIKLRISNHPSTIEEWGSKELTGLPNRRYSIVIFSSKSMPNESKQHIKETEWRSYLSQGIPVYEKCFNSLYLNETIQKLLTILKTIYNGGNPEDTSLAININENKEYKTNKNMSNNKIRITENELKQIVAESVKKILNEERTPFMDSEIAMGVHKRNAILRFNEILRDFQVKIGEWVNDEGLKGDLDRNFIIKIGSAVHRVLDEYGLINY